MAKGSFCNQSLPPNGQNTRVEEVLQSNDVEYAVMRGVWSGCWVDIGEDLSVSRVVDSEDPLDQCLVA